MFEGLTIRQAPHDPFYVQCRFDLDWSAAKKIRDLLVNVTDGYDDEEWFWGELSDDIHTLVGYGLDDLENYDLRLSILLPYKHTEDEALEFGGWDHPVDLDRMWVAFLPVLRKIKSIISA